MNDDRTAPLGIIAGNNRYPFLTVAAARAAGVKRIGAVAFEGETDPALAGLVDEIAWLRVGQLGKMLRQFKAWSISRAIMAGQIAPKNLFELRPDFRALLLLGRLRERNAESLFGAVADELANAGVALLPATTYLEDLLAAPGHLAGPAPGRAVRNDVDFGMRIAKEVSRLDIGQSVVVKKGTVLAVEAFEGTDDCIRRGGALGRGGGVLCKVSKPKQDLRFDVPVIGPRTVEAASAAGLQAIAIEAGMTLLLERDALFDLAARTGISLVGADAK
jgi:UDP-2,3-diacylglucosamine hydrolase